MELQNRYEFVMLFDVENGNPNGDPDAGNMPRVDAETSRCIVTDVCIKRKIRNYVEAVCENQEGYVSALLANKTGFSEEDLEIVLDSLVNMFEIDHSAARGKMCMRKVYVFKHDAMLGNAPSHILFDKINIKRKDEVDVARKFTDYNITIDGEMPEGVTLIERL